MEIKINIPAPVYFIIQELEKCGYEAYMVGGCVRDSVLGREPHDYDICTSARPDEILKVFPYEEIIPTGLQHGTVTILINDEAYEVTTYRIDGKYSDNRRPDKVEFTSNLIEDLKRRDFTINAMAYNPKTGLIDPFNGMEDIKNHIIRCVGNPKDRFSEDALRILRAIRFAAVLDFIIAEETHKAIIKLKDTLSNISMERINSEFCKIINSSNPEYYLNEYRDVISVFIPELIQSFDFKQNNPYHCYDVYYHSLFALNSYAIACLYMWKEDRNDIIVRLALFFHDIGKPFCETMDVNGISHFYGHAKISAEMTNEIMKRMKFDNETREGVVELISYHDATFKVDEKCIKRFLNKIGEKQFRRLLTLHYFDICAQSPKYKKTRLDKITELEQLLEKILQEKQCFSLKDLAVNGNDVKKVMMIKEGKDIGYWLNEILNRVIDGELKNNKEDLIYWMTGVVDGWIKI